MSKGHLLTPLPAVVHTTKKYGVFVNSVRYQDRSGQIHQFREGFISDGGSQPWLIHWLASRWSQYAPFFGLHDLYYWDQSIPREDADNLLYESLIDAEMNKALAKSIYLGVHIFGGRAWHKNEEKREMGLTRFVDIERQNWREEAKRLIA